MRISSHVISDVGRVRENNEDNFFLDDERALYVVADGMGGHVNGEVASRICVESVEAAYRDEQAARAIREQHQALVSAGRTGKSFAEFALQTALEFANDAIFLAARRDPDLGGMGTTAVAVQLVGDKVFLGYVGDSRVYRVRKGEIEQLSVDHSLANEYVRMRLLRPEDVPRFAYKNVIVRALGLGDQVEVDTAEHDCQPGDRLLLCSDGLSDLVTDVSIADAMAHAESPAEACRELVSMALRQGGVDNITVLCVWVEPDPDPE